MCRLVGLEVEVTVEEAQLADQSKPLPPEPKMEACPCLSEQTRDMLSIWDSRCAKPG